MAGTEGGDRKIKVVDRRWFDETGEPRRELKETRTGTGGQEAVPEPDSTVRQPAGDSGGDAGKAAGDAGSVPGSAEGGTAGGGVSWPSAVSFLQMVDFLAQQAAMLLSGAEGVPASPEQARIFIDFLGILEDRTRGNLTPEEARFLADVLFQLRAAYVQSTGG